ncbi:hypothetical protein SAMN04487935_0929 [Flavobacterium noncentrifugens]|uniref:Lipocalin-like domain-containing protein n=2 Tax=Flavobacterium noncentrifugens TaxID=1128970 RepID=A0A1G8TD74_9FLAO|nr:hypothetical protein SAMN04487935_0929 [Flavobacterium noncentrifugens]
MKTNSKLSSGLSLLAALFFLGCNSDDDNSNSNVSNISVVGKWTLYNTIFISDNSDHICQNSCSTFEFKANGTCLFTEHNELTSYTYRIDGDFIKYYNPTTESLEDTDRIISLTNTDLRLSIDDDGDANGRHYILKKN